MLEFVVIEDNTNYQNKIKNVINLVCLKQDFEYSIKKYKTLDNNLANEIKRDKPKIYIIDIELENNISGIDIARRIRLYDWKSIIIILTSHSELMYDVFKSQAMVLDFISKFDKYEEQLKVALNKGIKIIDNKKIIKFKANSINYKIYIEDIIYIVRETNERKSIINTTYGKTCVNLTLTNLLEKLPSYFYQVHRGCVVNTSKIKKFDSIKGIITFVNNEKTNLVSRYKKKGLLEYENSN